MKRDHGARERRMPEGEEDRPSVDYMDYGKPDGGPTRRLVGDGKLHELRSREGARSPTGEDAPEEEPTPDERT